NISRRVPRGFIITGSGSGRLSKLSSANYTVVTAYDLASNSVTSVGPVMASSESMTHAAIYKTDKNANAVFHMHHRGLWMHLLKWYPSTAKDVAYGTPEMAAEVTKLIHQLNGKLIFAMGGHEDGIISFGTDEDQAGQVVLDELKKLS
ncbi:MAG TPA: class II aldolase/adducin family protein, partial [Flavisolibacter sp.]|nr:class II aldolase/adducin family protein [Flavisolibacter sp.]